MLVTMSDLHLTDGTSGTTINSNAFNIFRERLKDLAYAASNRDVGGEEVYKPIDQIYVLLLGDILDVIRSTRWLQGKVRPWDDPTTTEFVSKVKEITEAILTTNQNALTLFQNLTRSGLKIKETKSALGETHTVQVLIYYVVGNHDWFFHLPGPDFNAIRTSIVNALGLANDPAQVFPHDTQEAPAVRKMCEEHHLFGRHGDIYDDANYEKRFGRDHSSLGDAIVIELVDRFAYEVERQLGTKAAEGLKEIDNVRPLELVPTFVDGLLRRSDDPAEAHRVRKIWNGVVDEFLKNDFVRRHRSSLKWGLKLSEGFSFRGLARLVPRAKELLVSICGIFPALNQWACRVGIGNGYYGWALGEDAFKNDVNISYIVYGHTHRHEIVPLRAGTGSGPSREDIYINSGTWRAVFDLSKYRPKDAEFFAYHVMTYLAFYKGDERRGKAFETWSGSLEYPMAAAGLQLAGAAAAKAQAAKMG